MSHPVFDDFDISDSEMVDNATDTSFKSTPLSAMVLVEEEHDRKELRLYGYLLLISAWGIFVAVTGSIFNVWQWIFQGFDIANWIRSHSNNVLMDFIIDSVLEQEYVMDNYYVCFFFLNFVILWIWAVGSWISMKLFRHSKGGGS